MRRTATTISVIPRRATARSKGGAREVVSGSEFPPNIPPKSGWKLASSLVSNRANQAEGIVTPRRSNGTILTPRAEASLSADRGMLDAESFRRMITLERKRSERSRKPFVLLLLDMGDRWHRRRTGKFWKKFWRLWPPPLAIPILPAGMPIDCVVGVMFTEIAVEDGRSIPNTVIARVTEMLRNRSSFEEFNRISLSFHVFPEDWDQDGEQGPSNPTLYPDLSVREESRKAFRVTKAHDGCAEQPAGAPVSACRFSCSIACAIKFDLERTGFLPAASHWPIWKAVCVSEISLDDCEQ